MEIFKRHPIYKRYKVSDKGRIFSTISNKFLKYSTTPAGYHVATLWENGECITTHVHKIVAQTFLANPEGKETINHIDAVKTNNNLDNLEWATRQENHKHAVSLGLLRRGNEVFGAKLNESDVVEIRKAVKEGVKHHELARKYGVSRSNIGAIVNRKSWAHID